MNITIQDIPITLLFPDWVSHSERERLATLLQRPLLDPAVLKTAIKHLQDINTEA